MVGFACPVSQSPTLGSLSCTALLLRPERSSAHRRTEGWTSIVRRPTSAHPIFVYPPNDLTLAVRRSFSICLFAGCTTSVRQYSLTATKRLLSSNLRIGRCDRYRGSLVVLVQAGSF